MKNIVDAIGSFALLSIGIITCLQPQTPRTIASIPDAQPVVYSSTENGLLMGSSLPEVQNRKLTVSIAVSDPSDVKVAEGDKVTKGQTLADQTTERAALLARKQSITMSLNQIRQARSLTLPRVDPVAPIAPLPKANFSEELTAIETTRRAIESEERRVKQWEIIASNPPYQQLAEVQEAQMELEQFDQKVELQTRSVDVIESLQDLPNAEMIATHENQVLESLQASRNANQAKLDQAIARLELASNEQNRQLEDARSRLSQAISDHDLAIARLEGARATRQHEEYLHSIKLQEAQREANRAKSEEIKQRQQIQESERERQYQIAQLEVKLAEVDQQIAQLAEIKAPYSAEVRRIKYEGQDGNKIKVNITLSTHENTAPNPSNNNSIDTAFNTSPISGRGGLLQPVPRRLRSQ